MNTAAVGAFLRGYRKERNMKAEDVAEEVGRQLGRTVGRATIYRIEAGDHSSGFDIFLGIVAALRVAAARVQEIALSEMSPAEGERLGRRAAKGEYDGALTPEEIEVLSRLSPEKRRRAIELIRQLLAE